MSLKNKSGKGFTLVELLVTISILAILSTVSIVGYTSFIKKSAIEADESLVKQLNIFTDAYLVKHYSNLPDDNRIIADVLDESGVKPLTLQSREYGYDLWFKCSENTFELKENFSGNKDYINVLNNSNITPPTSNSTTTTTTTTTNNPPQSDTPEDTEKEPEFVLEDFVQKEYASNSTYAYSKNGEIHIGIKDEGTLTPITLLLENISIIEKSTQIKWNIVERYINNTVVDKSYTFTYSGQYILRLGLIEPDSNNDTIYYVDININCCNVHLKNAVITFTPDSHKYIINKDETSIEIIISDSLYIWDNSLKDYNMTYQWDTMTRGERLTLINNLQIIIKDDISEKNYIFIEHRYSNQGYYYSITINNIDFSNSIYECVITYKYLGENGLYSYCSDNLCIELNK